MAYTWKINWTFLQNNQSKKEKKKKIELKSNGACLPPLPLAPMKRGHFNTYQYRTTFDNSTDSYQDSVGIVSRHYRHCRYQTIFGRCTANCCYAVGTVSCHQFNRHCRYWAACVIYLWGGVSKKLRKLYWPPVMSWYRRKRQAADCLPVALCLVGHIISHNLIK